MSVQFVLVNKMAPRNPAVCVACSQPLERGYLHDISTSRRYCGIECYRRWNVVSEFVGTGIRTDPLELAFAWPRLAIDVGSAMFDSTWGATIGPDA
jgi:hypothetical protein